MTTTKSATHTDTEGNFYRVIGEKAQQFCVDYWNKNSQSWVQDMGKDYSHLMPLKKAWSTIQCKAPSGEIGCFLYSHKDENGYNLVSEVFPSFAALAVWCKANNWKAVGGLNGWYELQE